MALRGVVIVPVVKNGGDREPLKRLFQGR